ncbi:PAS domain-containing protein [bacterium]|nr:PAS domain-containing protein [bacterium]MBU1983008.1 PAS domain-containing protein [bacterium]
MTNPVSTSEKPFLPTRTEGDAVCRVLLLSIESAWSAEFRSLTKGMGFRLKRVERPVEALIHMQGFDPHLLLVNEFRSDGLTLLDLCDALRIPRQLRPLSLLTTTQVPIPPGEDLGDLGIDDIFDTEIPVHRLSSSLMQHFRLAVSQRKVLDREREILDSLPDALVVLGSDLTLWKANRAFAELFGIEDPQELRRQLGRPLMEAITAGSVGGSMSGAGALTSALELARRNRERSFQFRILRPSSERFLAGQITELAGEDEQMLVALRDVTDREQRLLREARRERLATIGNLAVGVAHEIQNPNTFSRVNAANLKSLFQALLPFLEELAEKETDAKIGAMSLLDLAQKIEAAITGVETASQRIAMVLDTLKGFGQISGDAVKEVDLRTVVAEAELLTKHVLRGKATLTNELPDSLPPVWASASQLSQVFINLIENAVQAFDFPGPQMRDKGEGTIRIHLDSENEEEIVVAVSDNGPGIDEELQATIFRPFFTTRAQGVGTGLGLSLSSDIVRRFGGDLSVRSRRGQGACFLATLKRADTKAASERHSEGNYGVQDHHR